MTTNGPPAAGSKIGDYILDAYIGGGSFGAVWKGHPEGTEDEVAVKLLTGALASDTAVRAEVEVLAAAAASRSSHVVKVLGGGTEPVPYIVMEFVRGSDLQSVLRDQGHLSVDQTIAVGLAIADALRALDEVDIIHRDIKPANVMIDDKSVIKLADFGIAKIAGYETVTMGGQAPMTMAYAAPEIWDERGKFGRPSHRSDLYAMGILLYQCLTGETPFSGNYGALFKAHTEDLPDFTLLPGETPASLAFLIRACLEKRQERRPRDAIECTALVSRAEVELKESRGESTGEPRKIGPWLKNAPHPNQPWAWRCRNEATAETATVEVHFSSTIEHGAHLRRAINANAHLVLLGAERLLGTNRLLLHPSEVWQAAPAGQFQFWIAREDRPVTPATWPVTPAALASTVAAIGRLIAAAAGESVSLDLSELTLEESGSLQLKRPGLREAPGEAGTDALAFLRSLQLDSGSLALLATTTTFDGLAARLGADLADATAVPDSDATRIVPVATDATVLSPWGNKGPSVPDAEATRIAFPPPAPAPEETICTRCLAPIHAGDAFCGNCGQRLPAVVDLLCPRCRYPITDEDVFCANCGQRLETGSVRRTPTGPVQLWPQVPSDQGERPEEHRKGFHPWRR